MRIVPHEASQGEGGRGTLRVVSIAKIFPPSADRPLNSPDRLGHFKVLLWRILPAHAKREAHLNRSQAKRLGIECSVSAIVSVP